MQILTQASYLTALENRSGVFQDATLDQNVLEIISQVRNQGDKALFRYTEQFDQVKLDSLVVTEAEINEARQQVSNGFIQALKQAKENISRFHKAQVEQSWFINDENGNMLGQKITPLEKVGVYVPGGKAAYPSTVLMNVLPAKLAGVSSIAVVTPPQSDGTVNPYVLAAAYEAGVDHIYKVGGAQAIAALAYGTSTIEKVAKIVGPGNAYVARAKKWVFGDVAIDMIAGPSEICIIADETANPRYAAADLLSQAEHDERAKAVCITTSKQLAEAIQVEIEKQLASLERNTIIKKSLSDHGKIIIADSLEEAFALANTIAPEHLQLMVKNPAENVHFVKNAGAIFLGPYSPEPLGDYFAGPNHTLPTNGSAIFSSPLGVYDFVKKSSIIHYTKSSLLQASEQIVTLAEAEGLTAHANAINVRKDANDA
ncbi:histidinol dehydrogenase [Virgibacillus dakarensis]|uniref:histidinol dehydrogenase n=1 Tax=Virgibacillus dakarensis TaxID=1917889 RepID=UPI000B450E82|nr:histidinol dehydrogenase [Virgibacillus dakarensis]